MKVSTVLNGQWRPKMTKRRKRHTPEEIAKQLRDPSGYLPAILALIKKIPLALLRRDPERVVFAPRFLQNRKLLHRQFFRRRDRF
jgi:hypothetical protein